MTLSAGYIEREKFFFIGQVPKVIAREMEILKLFFFVTASTTLATAHNLPSCLTHPTPVLEAGEDIRLS